MARREAAEYLIGSLGLSKSRASRLVGLCRNTLGYEAMPDKDEALRRRMKELKEKETGITGQD